MKIFYKTKHKPEQQSGPHFQEHIARRYNGLTRIILCAGAFIFLLSALSCTDPVASKKKHYNNGLAHLETKDISTAIIEFKNVIQIDPMHADAYFHLGKAYLLAGKFDSAIMAFEKATDINPSIEKDSGLFLARAYMMTGELDKALVKLNTVSKEKAGDAEVLNVFGSIYLRKKETVKAKDYFNKALKANPMLVSSHINLGKLLIMENKLKEAHIKFKKALELEPDNLPASYAMADLLSREKKFDAAIQIYSDLLKRNKKQSAARI